MSNIMIEDELLDGQLFTPDYEIKINQYKQDLRDYIETLSTVDSDNKEYIRRYLLNKLEDKWIRILGFNRTLIQMDITEMQTPKQDFVTSLTLKEALGNFKPGSSWLIPELLRSVGLYILAGEPKVGKTLLINALIYSVALSGKFLGKPTRTGNVLYIQLEESIDTIAERLFFAGFGNLMDEETSLLVNFVDRVRIERQFDITTDLDWLINKIREYKPILVVIDSLRMAQLKSNASENSNEYGKSVYALQRVFNFTNTCGVIIHHMSKLGGRNAQKTSLIERLAGHTSISAGSDGIIGLRANTDENTGEKSIILDTLPRQGLPINIEYRIKTGDDGLWKLDKLSEDTSALNPNTSRILRFLASNPDQFYTEAQIATAINSTPFEVRFKQALRYLESSQIIVSKYVSHRFTYALTSDSLWIVNPQSIREMVSPAIVDANALMRCANKRELRDLVTTWDRERQTEAKKCLLQTEKDRITNLINSWEFEVDQLVSYEGAIVRIVAIEDRKPTLKGNKYYLEDIADPVKEIDLIPIDVDDIEFMVSGVAELENVSFEDEDDEDAEDLTDNSLPFVGYEDDEDDEDESDDLAYIDKEVSEQEFEFAM